MFAFENKITNILLRKEYIVLRFFFFFKSSWRVKLSSQLILFFIFFFQFSFVQFQKIIQTNVGGDRLKCSQLPVSRVIKKSITIFSFFYFNDDNRHTNIIRFSFRKKNSSFLGFREAIKFPALDENNYTFRFAAVKRYYKINCTNVLSTMSSLNRRFSTSFGGILRPLSKSEYRFHRRK